MTKLSALTGIIEGLGKKPTYFSKNLKLVRFVKSYYFKCNLQIKIFQTQNRTLASIQTLSIDKNVEKTVQSQRFEWMVFFPFL